MYFDKRHVYADRMRRSWGLAWCALAACGKHGGTEIVVKTPTGATIDQIALYIGVGHAQSDAIGPQGYSAAITDKMTWWGHDANGRDVASRVGSEVTFEYQAAGSSTDQLGVVVAVAFDQGQPVAAAYQQTVVVPVSSVAKYTLELQPVTDPKQAVNSLGIEVWGPPGDDTACVWVADAPNATELMVVDSNDPDCDGVTANECDDHVYLAHRGPSIGTDANHIHCLADELISKGAGSTVTACVLGGDLCVDGAGWTPGCVNGVYCVPRSACNACNMAASTDAFGCLADVYHYLMPPTTTPTFTSIECSLPLDANGTVCASTVMFDATSLAATYGRTCKGQPLLFDVASGRWDNQTQVRGVQIEIDNPQSTCSFSLGISGAVANPTMQTPPSLLVAANLDNGRGIAIPITFHYTSDCGTPTCQYGGASGIFGTIGDNFVPDCVNTPPNYPP